MSEYRGIKIVEDDSLGPDEFKFVDFERRLREAQVDLEPEFQKIFNDHYWELLA